MKKSLPPLCAHGEFHARHEVWTDPYIWCLSMRSGIRGVNRPYLLCHAWAWTGSYFLCLRPEQTLPPVSCMGVNRLLPSVLAHEEFDCEAWTDLTSCVMHGREQALTFCACAWGVWLWGVNRPYLLCHAWAWTGSYLLCLRMSSSSARREVPCLRPQVRNLRAESMFLPMIISWNTSRMIPSSTESTMFYNYNI